MSERHLVSIAKNSLTTAFGNIFVIIVVPITSLLTTNVLGAELFGVYSLVQSWCGFLANFSSLGLNGTNLRFIPRYRALASPERIKGSILWTLKITAAISLMFSLFLFFYSDVFCEVFIHRPESISQDVFDRYIVSAFRFFAPSIFLTAIYLVFQSSLSGLKELRFKVLANDIFGNIFKVLFLILFFSAGTKLYGALASSLIQDLVVLLLSLYFLIKVYPGLTDMNLKSIVKKKELNKFASVLFANSVLSKYTFQMDVLFLGYFCSIKDVGIYALASRLQTLIYMPHYALNSIFGPITAELYAQNNMEEFKKLYRTITKWTFSVSLPIAAIIVLFSEDILHLFGKDFTGAVLIIVIMSVGNLIHDFLGTAGTVIMMTGRIHVNLINSIILSVFNITSYYVLIKEYGIVGAAVANAFSLTIANLLVLFEVRYFVGFYPFRVTLVKPLIGVIFAGGLVLLWKTQVVFDNQYLFLLQIVVLTIVYLLVLYVLRFDEEDRMIINKIFQKIPFLKRIALK